MSSATNTSEVMKTSRFAPRWSHRCMKKRATSALFPEAMVSATTTAQPPGKWKRESQ